MSEQNGTDSQLLKRKPLVRKEALEVEGVQNQQPPLTLRRALNRKSDENGTDSQHETSKCKFHALTRAWGKKCKHSDDTCKQRTATWQSQAFTHANLLLLACASVTRQIAFESRNLFRQNGSPSIPAQRESTYAATTLNLGINIYCEAIVLKPLYLVPYVVTIFLTTSRQHRPRFEEICWKFLDSPHLVFTTMPGPRQDYNMTT